MRAIILYYKVTGGVFLRLDKFLSNMGKATRSESGKDVAVIAAEKLKEKYPALNIVAHRHGYYAKSGEENETLREN